MPLIEKGAKRLCDGCDSKVVYNGSKWFHPDKDSWVTKPHKAAPRKYADANIVKERQTKPRTHRR